MASAITCCLFMTKVLVKLINDPWARQGKSPNQDTSHRPLSQLQQEL
jgi:hypothetical protein